MAKRRKFGGLRRVARRVRRRAGVALVKAGRSARRTAGEHKAEFITPGVTVATAAAIGYLDNPERPADAFKLPRVMGVMPEAVGGVVLGVLGTMVAPTAKGTAGKVIRGAAAGMVSVAAYKMASGGKLYDETASGDDSDDDGVGYTED